MGGNVAWTLRLQDGTEYRMQRWTNVFGGVDGITSSDDFLRGDPKAIEQSLESWLSMKADWEENRDTENYRENMTSVYAPYPYGLRPSEYGFFVTDFPSKTIISCQYYTTLMRFQIYRKYLNPTAITENDTAVNCDSLSEQYGVLKVLHQQGRIASFENSNYESQLADNMDLDDLIRDALKEHPDLIRSSDPSKLKIIGYVNVRPVEPWQILDFRADQKSGRAAAFSAVKDLGFSLNESETRDFEKWIKGYDEDA